MTTPSFIPKEIQAVAYEWICPTCSKVISDGNRNRCIAHAKQHWFTKHDSEVQK